MTLNNTTHPTTSTPWTFRNVSNNFTYVQPFTDSEADMWTLLYWFFMILGVTGNLFTVYLITKTKVLLKNPYLRMILSLSCGGVFKGLSSCTFVYQRTFGWEYYVLPELICKITWGIDSMVATATATTILAFTIMKCVTVQNPHKKLSIKTASITAGGLWLLSFGLVFIPHFIAFGVSQRDRSGNNPDVFRASCALLHEHTDFFHRFARIVMPLLLMLPIVLMIVTSIYLVVRVKKAEISVESTNAIREKRRVERDSQILRQIVAIVILFLIGNLPVYLHGIIKSSFKHQPISHKLLRLDYFWGQMSSASFRLSNALSPIVYVCMSRKMFQSACDLVTSKKADSHQQNSRTTSTSSNPTAACPEETQV